MRARDVQRVTLSPKLVVEYPTGTAKPELDAAKLAETESHVRESIRLRQAIAALEVLDDAHKQAIADTLGDDATYIHYRGKKRWWKLSIYLNYSLSPARVQAKLADHPELIKKYLAQGVVFQAVVATTKQGLKLIQSAIRAAIGKLQGQMNFIKGQLEPMITDEDGLIQECKDRRISLAGTQVRRVTMYVNEESKPPE